MESKDSLRRQRQRYAKLLRLYPKAYHERFGEGMEQTFTDLCRERSSDGKGLTRLLVWIVIETVAGIIRENLRVMFRENRRIVWIVLITASILMVPWVTGAPWNLFDYIVGGGLLLGSGLAYHFMVSRARSMAYRVAAAIAVFSALILVWMNLAVGVIGSEDHPANLMYAGVLAIGLIGAIVARFRPAGMARALFATAIAQALVPVIAVAIWQPGMSVGVIKVFILNSGFVMLFVGSALFFRRASAAVTKQT